MAWFVCSALHTCVQGLFVWWWVLDLCIPPPIVCSGLHCVMMSAWVASSGFWFVWLMSVHRHTGVSHKFRNKGVYRSPKSFHMGCCPLLFLRFQLTNPGEKAALHKTCRLLGFSLETSKGEEEAVGQRDSLVGLDSSSTIDTVLRDWEKHKTGRVIRTLCKTVICEHKTCGELWMIVYFTWIWCLRRSMVLESNPQYWINCKSLNDHIIFNHVFKLFKSYECDLSVDSICFFILL